ncbi:acyltransferase [Hyphomonas sp.]|uniref:acyltransferase family protein n=1 Tax=Hyphomonas sp. TaxID=87 RepID=UPI001DC4735E|nr:acyltransferase [Hyphomonas sp.]MBU3920554.1 acyltransferase [Alphaproteobacteria bacterium]MBU4062276.1 acyltransferase [Alphaproteobacteria bacterium]
MKLQSIQALRGMAALMVVLYHARALEIAGIDRAAGTESALIGGLFASGFAGVDLFFVISGFIMVWVTRNVLAGPATSAYFLFGRLTRIYPVWWAAAALGLLYMVLSGGVALIDSSGLAIRPETPEYQFLLKSFLLIPQPDFPVLLIGWTLIHEVYFYIVFALILMLPRAWLPYTLLVWGICVVAASLLGLSMPMAQNLMTLAIHPMTMEFIFGAVVGILVTSGLIWRAGTITLLAALGLVAALGLQAEPTHYTLQWGRVLEFGLPCAALVYGLAGLDVRGRLAWLVPALVGAVVAGLVFQLFGLVPQSPQEARRGAVILAVLVGGLAMLIVLWAGWLLGQARPGWLLAMAPFWRGLLDRVSQTGDWSYSIYLFHLFALGIVQRLMARTGAGSDLAPWLRLGAPGLNDNLVFLIGGTVSALAAGWLGYMVVERPALFVFGWLRRLIFRRRSSAAG